MNSKTQTIANIKRILEENKLDRIILDKTIYTRCPDDDSLTFSIHELFVSGDEVTAWQGYGYLYSPHEELKHFSEVCLGQVEEELKRTISLLKTYEVKVIGHVVIRATQPKYAKEAIQLHPCVFNDLVWIDPTDEIKER